MISVRHTNAREATPVGTPTLVASRAIVTQRVYTVFATNTSGSVRYLQLFDAQALPADTTVPIISATMAANGTTSIVYPTGRVLRNGLVAANSSTQGTLTIAGADLLIDVTHD